MSKMLLKILQMLLFFNYGVQNIFSFGFIEALDFKGILISAMEFPDEIACSASGFRRDERVFVLIK